MLLTYLDESYTKDHYYMAALCCPDDQVVSLSRALDEVVRVAAAKYKVAAGAELHGRSIFHADDEWVGMKQLLRARIGIYDAAMQAIGGHEVSLILRGVDVRRLHARYGPTTRPHVLVLQHLMERINLHARRCAPPERVLLIADEIDGQDGYRRHLWHYRQHGTPGYRSSRLERIVDTIHFAPSHASRLIQAADLVAFLHRRRMTIRETDERAERVNAQLWGRVAGRVVHEREWTP
ncbi:DUF3800 domain-containing protein [Phytoactinopolyspora mesophila]|uniref:DUF3800 domain-containing protein n=1 Tax=Phytoactinopolyspora mesophila TaxID=2650750 RepID=A0A7K3M0Z6_9ACTN|nr:DUF3800 domain-containing protein [Phytoactinopolyspora mesophila]NDL56971.1 DUF3800 domain-containing protein [Phytoactinopolyspora mesophila]